MKRSKDFYPITSNGLIQALMGSNLKNLEERLEKTDNEKLKASLREKIDAIKNGKEILK